MRFIHAADLHLDSPLTGLRERAGARAADLAGATQRAFGEMVRFAIDEKVDLVLLAGDIFDGDWSDFKSGLEFIKGLAELDRAGIRVAMIRGNHDAANKMSRRLKWPKNTYEFSHRAAEVIVLENLGVAIHGQSFPQGAVPQNLAQTYPPRVDALFNIGLLHTSTNAPGGHETYAPCSLDDLKAKGYEYWALGHVHTRAVLCADPHIIFPGNLQGRHINEPGAHGFMLVEVAAGRVVSADFVACDVLRWRRLTVDLSAAATFDAALNLIGQALSAALAQAEGRTLATRIALTGATALHGELIARSDALEAECDGLALAASAEIWIEQICIETRPLADERADAGGLAALVASIAANPAEVIELRRLVETGLQKLPAEIRKAADLEVFSEARFAGVVADAEALLRYRLTGKDRKL